MQHPQHGLFITFHLTIIKIKTRVRCTIISLRCRYANWLLTLLPTVRVKDVRRTKRQEYVPLRIESGEKRA
jgi:hypothetical protein